MKDTAICQSCGMPMEKDELKGSEANGVRSEKYCTYCYQDGKFTQDITVDEMIENNLKFLDEWNKGTGRNFTTDEARTQLKAYLPTLERWK